MQRRSCTWRSEETRYWNVEFVGTSRAQTQERCGTNETGVCFCSCRQSAVNQLNFIDSCCVWLSTTDQRHPPPRCNQSAPPPLLLVAAIPLLTALQWVWLKEIMQDKRTAAALHWTTTYETMRPCLHCIHPWSLPPTLKQLQGETGWPHTTDSRALGNDCLHSLMLETCQACHVALTNVTRVIGCGGGVGSLWSVSHAAPRPLLKPIGVASVSVSVSDDSKKIGVSVSVENGVLGLTLVTGQAKIDYAKQDRI